ncbi:MAG: hypothetical protein U0175_20600 [Caldilineaceae bacterium]
MNHACQPQSGLPAHSLLPIRFMANVGISTTAKQSIFAQCAHHYNAYNGITAAYGNAHGASHR